MSDEYSGNERFPTVDERELRCIYVFSEDPDLNDIIRTIDTAQIPTNNNTNVSANRSKKHEQTEQEQNLDEVPLENIFRDFSSRHFLCSDDIDIKSEMFLFDRTTADHPIKVTETVPAYLNYTVPSHDGKGVDVEMCIVIMPMDRTTAAIGDVDGDGILDVVSIVGWMGEKIDSGYSYTESIFWTYIKKISLGPIIKDKGNRIFTDVESTVVNNPKDKDISDIDILSIDQQKWTQYMGNKGNGHYTDKNKEV